MLVAERGLRNTRRNRRWLAFLRLIEDRAGLGPNDAEALAWKLVKTWEGTP